MKYELSEDMIRQIMIYSFTAGINSMSLDESRKESEERVINEVFKIITPCKTKE